MFYACVFESLEDHHFAILLLLYFQCEAAGLALGFYSERKLNSGWVFVQSVRTGAQCWRSLLLLAFCPIYLKSRSCYRTEASFLELKKKKTFIFMCMYVIAGACNFLWS